MLKRFKGLLRIVFVSLFALMNAFIVTVKAQQRPQYTQYAVNNFILNPAISGIENYADVRIGRRNQWVNITGAPVTTYLTAHMPLGDAYLRENANSAPTYGSNPFSRSYLQNYMAADPHHGIGFIGVFDQVGPFYRTDVAFTYAYHIGLSRSFNMSVGVAPGLSVIKLDMSKVNFGTGTDPVVGSISKSLYRPDLAAGLWFYGAQLFFGVSAQQIIPQKLVFGSSEQTTGTSVPHLFYTAGFKFSLDEELSFQPSVMVKQIQNVPTSVDVNLKTMYKDFLWFGTSYRTTDSFAFVVGINPTYYLNISYSFDMVQSALSVATSGTHEVVIGVLLNNKYQASCPKKMW